MNNPMELERGKLIQPISSSVTLLRVKPGYFNNRGEIYDKNGTYIDFPRELDEKNRENLDVSSVNKRYANHTVGCLVHERRNYSYYHWTYETLPKLVYLSQNRQAIKVDKLYFHYGFWGHSYQRQAVRKLGFNFWQILDAKRIKSLMAKEIVVVRLNDSRFTPSVELCQAIKSAFVQQPIENPFRRIYLTRDHVKTGRRVVNEPQLRELLRAYGFQIVIADKLSVADQAKLFNESQYIVSPHGAALANMVFCEPGTKILELFNQVDPSAWKPVYSRIAATCGFELTPLAPKQVVQDNKHRHRADMVADLNAIRATLLDWGL